jgi:hypothetical protein
LKAALEWRQFPGSKCQWQGQREKQEERGGKNKPHLVKGKKGVQIPKSLLTPEQPCVLPAIINRQKTILKIKS